MSGRGMVPGMMSGAASTMGLGGKAKRGPTLKQLKDEFMQEMRHLSKLRHPCITTVMGAMIDKGDDPMLIMGTYHGSHLAD